MSRRRIFCEGVDDRAALRGLLRRGFGLQSRPGPASATESKPSQGAPMEFVPKQGGLPLVLLGVSGDRSKVLAQAVDIAKFGSPSEPAHILGLSFDPNGDPQAAWRQWIVAGFRELNPREDGDGWRVDTPAGPTRVLPLPWESQRASLNYDLPDKQSLERIAVQALAEAYPDRHDAVGRWMAEVPRLGVPERWRWKSALRLWNALVRPDTSADASLLDQVFEQDHQVRDRVIELLKGTVLWRGLEAITASAPQGAEPT